MLIVEENSPTILAASVIKKNGQKFNHWTVENSTNLVTLAGTIFLSVPLPLTVAFCHIFRWRKSSFLGTLSVKSSSPVGRQGNQGWPQKSSVENHGLSQEVLSKITAFHKKFCRKSRLFTSFSIDRRFCRKSRLVTEIVVNGEIKTWASTYNGCPANSGGLCD
jgi:hypothetical protein